MKTKIIICLLLFACNSSFSQNSEERYKILDGWGARRLTKSEEKSIRDAIIDANEKAVREHRATQGGNSSESSRPVSAEHARAKETINRSYNEGYSQMMVENFEGRTEPSYDYSKGSSQPNWKQTNRTTATTSHIPFHKGTSLTHKERLNGAVPYSDYPRGRFLERSQFITASEKSIRRLQAAKVKFDAPSANALSTLYTSSKTLKTKSNNSSQSSDISDNWPYQSKIPITQYADTVFSKNMAYTDDGRLVTEEEFYAEMSARMNSLHYSNRTDFENTISKMKPDELQNMRQVYHEYGELIEIADYSYHEHPLSEEMRKNGWNDVSTENANVNKICNDAEMNSITENSGLKLSVLRNGDRYVIAFGGTDFNKIKELYKDAKTDVEGMFSLNEQQVQRAKEAVRRLVEEANIPIEKMEFTGHSLGGRIAAEMSVEYARPATTYNAAGVSEQRRKQYEFLLANSKNGYTGVRNVVTEHDVLTNVQERILSGSANPYLRALPKQKIQIIHETLSSKEGIVVKKTLDVVCPPVGKLIDVADKTLKIADKVNTYYNRDYRALGGTFVIPDDESGFSVKAHKLSSIKGSLNSRLYSINKMIEDSSNSVQLNGK